VQALARRSSAQLKGGGTSSTRPTTLPRNEYFADSDDDENNSGRRKFSSDPARRAKPNSNYRDERTRSAPSLNSVLRQYKGDEVDSEFPREEPTSGPKVWGKVADSTAYRREDRRQKLPLDSGFFSRSSFKEIGCGDEILGALSSFGFPQPSHIQVTPFIFLCGTEKL
jgi:ATP-dependent RNA helicase DDX18/HAS1